MYSSLYNSRPKANHIRVASTPIFINKLDMEHAKLGNNKFDNISIESNYSITDYQSHRLSPSQSSNHQYPYKSVQDKDQLHDMSHSLLTWNNNLSTEAALSLTARTESIIEKMEKFELKLQESKKIIENLKQERTLMITQADKIDEILATQKSPTQKLRTVHPRNQFTSPKKPAVQVVKTQSGSNSYSTRPTTSKTHKKAVSFVPPIRFQSSCKIVGPLSTRSECSTMTNASWNKSTNTTKKVVFL